MCSWEIVGVHVHFSSSSFVHRFILAVNQEFLKNNKISHDMQTINGTVFATRGRDTALYT